MIDLSPPKWAREIERFLPIKPQFQLCGNIHDVFPIQFTDSIATLNLANYLREMLIRKGYALVVLFEPMVGFSLLHGDAELFSRLAGESLSSGTPLPATLDRAAKIASRLVDSSIGHTALIIRFASRIEELCESDHHDFFYNLFRLSITATPKVASTNTDTATEADPIMFNPIFWIMDKENDLPAWYILNNPRIRTLPIPRPDNQLRSCIIEAVSPKIPGYDDLDDEAQKQALSIFTEKTTGLLAGEIASIAQLARRESMPLQKIDETIRNYKLGVVENLWAKLDPQKIINSETFLNAKILGQPVAVRHSSDILKRSRYNLSGSQFSRFSQRPKGVLFLAGPTGVGKTELAKTITELIFGSPTHCIRFDMSEFAHEHADQRLIGSPPGYIGYDTGGELTNAIRQNPFSVLLFDEIEKANPKILDMFLQILDDGRLTSGRGDTVYFSESIIIFTSNLGMFDLLPDGTKIQKVRAEMSYAEIQSSIVNSIEYFFKYKINRPEILNRIGKNIVVFDFIREKTGAEIAIKMINNVLFKLYEEHKITLRFTDEASLQIIKAICADLSMGGRGIGSNLELVFINPLSRKLCELETLLAGSPDQERTYTVLALKAQNDLWELDITLGGKI